MLLNGRLLRLKLLALATFAATLAVLSLSNPSASALDTAIVSGTVLSSNGSALSGVSVYATSPGSSSVSFGPVTTDSNGFYSLDVAVGTYDFHFNPPSGSNMSPLVDSNETILNATTINIQLTSATHTVSGVATDQNGNPLTGEQVFLSPVSDTSEGARTTASVASNGSFTLTVPTGNYLLGIRLLNRSSALITSSHQFDLSSNIQQDIQVNLVPLTVKVVDQNGNPVANASVTAGSIGINSNAPSILPGVPAAATVRLLNSLDATTGPAGTVTFTVPAGASYSQRFGTTSTLDNIYAVLPGGAKLYLDEPVTINGPTTVILAQPASFTVSGIATDQNGNPLAGQQVYLSPVSDLSEGARIATSVASNGSYSLTTSTGTYVLGVRLLGSGINVRNLHQFNLSSNIQQDIRIDLVPLTVKVVDQNGDPVANAAVTAGNATYNGNAPSIFPNLSDPSEVMQYNSLDATTGPAGTVTFTVPAGASYSQRFGTTSTLDNIYAVLPGGLRLYLGGPVVINAATTITLAQPPATHTISGVATDQYGNPLVGERVYVSPVSDTSEGASTTTIVAPDGSFTLTVPVGSYLLGINLFSIGTRITTPHQFDLSNNIQQDIRIDLVPLTIKVVDQNGNPVADASVTAGNVTYNDNVPSMFPGISAPSVVSQFNSLNASTNAAGTVAFTVAAGVSYGQTFGATSTLDNIYAVLPGGLRLYIAAPLTVTGPTTVVLAPEQAAVDAPTGLSASSPIKTPSLTWNAVNNADSYNVYRNGVKIASTSLLNYVDTGAPEGTQLYTVTALAGTIESPSSASVSVVVDRTAPSVSTPVWSSNPVQEGQGTTLTVSASDSLSGVSQVTYIVDGGLPQQMTYNSATGTWVATLGAGLATGTYSIVIQATDNAGNVSAGVVDVLVVYTTSNGYVTGHFRSLPTADDTMPIGLDTSNNPTKLIVGFTNLIAPTNGSFDIAYSIKNNTNEFTLSSTSISWIVVTDSNHASILGTADLTTYVNGVATVTTNLSVRFDIVIGTNGEATQVTIQMFDPGVDPNTGTPTYVISNTGLANSNVMIHP